LPANRPIKAANTKTGNKGHFLSRQPPSQLANLILGTDPDTRRRSGLVLLGSSLYSLNSVLCWWAIGEGYIHAQIAHVLIAYMLTGPALFYLLIRLRLSQAFKDPSMVMAQSLFCIGAIVIGYASTDKMVRSGLLAILPLVLMLGQFTFHPRQIAIIARVSLGALVAVNIIWWFARPDHSDTKLDLAQLIYIGGIVLITTRVAQIVSSIRYKLEQSRQELADALAKMQAMASHDELTGLANRRHMQSLLEEEVKRVRRQEQPMTVAILDLDHFKHINDTYGHQVGDEVLRHFADLASTALREVDILARWGGEEFLLLCPASTDIHAITGLNRLRTLLQNSSLLPELPALKVTFSAGVAHYMDGEAIKETIARADKALYQAKANGRDRIVQSP
jgi:diguanylate cyclase (GGDEF)-like protein